MMLSTEEMDMDMETPSCVWSILDPLVLNLVQWEVVVVKEEEDVEEEEEEEDLGEDLDPQPEDLNSGS